MTEEQTVTNASTESAEAALESVEDAAVAVKDALGNSDALSLPDLNDGSIGRSEDGATSGMSLLSDVALRVKIELGRTQMYVEDVLRLNPDSVIELDKAAGDPVDIYVNDRLVARGEVLVLNESFCVRISEIIQPPQAED